MYIHTYIMIEFKPLGILKTIIHMIPYPLLGGIKGYEYTWPI